MAPVSPPLATPKDVTAAALRMVFNIIDFAADFDILR